MSSQLRGVEVLQSEIEKSRDKLKNFNENIKKLTGFENPGPRARRILSGENPDIDGRLGRGRGRLFGIAKRGMMGDGGPAAKRRVVGGAFSRLGPPPASARRREREDSPYEEELPHKLSLQSSVVATSREAKNREEIMQEQTKDKEGMQRNRRMFGLLLGTLNKFKTESKSLASKEEQRKQIDKKLEENAEKEKKKYKQETKQLMEEMHLEETRISRLEQKMEVVQEHNDWEKEVKRLKNFICTKAKPRIFWLPRQLNSVLESKLKESNKVVDGILNDGQVRLEKEIQDVMERENKREERIKMRLREDGLFQENEEKDNDSRKSIDDRCENIERGDVVDRLEESVIGKQTEPKSKQKRRVVIEQDSDEGSESDNNEQKGQNKKSERGSENLKAEDVPKGKKSVHGDSDRDDEEKSDSDGDEDEDENGRDVQISRAKTSTREEEEEEEGGQSDKVVSSSKGRSKERHRSREEGQNEEEEEEEVARVVMHRSSSKDKERTRKEKHRRDSGGKGKDRDDRKSSRDSKRSSRHSRRSRKDDDRLIIKQERVEDEEKKKKKVTEKEDEEKGNEEEAGFKSTRNPTTLLGEDVDVEMESEHNVTM